MLREASEDMRNAETGMRRQDSQQAANSGSRAWSGYASSSGRYRPRSLTIGVVLWAIYSSRLASSPMRSGA